VNGFREIELDMIRIKLIVVVRYTVVVAAIKIEKIVPAPLEIFENVADSFWLAEQRHQLLRKVVSWGGQQPPIDRCTW
jgi:hypothetical protein